MKGGVPIWCVKTWTLFAHASGEPNESHVVSDEDEPDVNFSEDAQFSRYIYTRSLRELYRAFVNQPISSQLHERTNDKNPPLLTTLFCLTNKFIFNFTN